MWTQESAYVCNMLLSMVLQKVNTRVNVNVVTVKMTSDVHRWKISCEFCLAIWLQNCRYVQQYRKYMLFLLSMT